MNIYKFLIALSLSLFMQCFEEKKISVVIPSYNNAKYIEKNLQSITSQNYKNFQIIYVNDASTDNTGQLAKQLLSKSNIPHTVINHAANRKPSFSRWHAIHLCHDDDIVVLVDGDDFLAHANVLQEINKAYQYGDTWLTYGTYKRTNGQIPDIKYKIPDRAFRSNSFRVHEFVSTHLRTFYAWLYKEIPVKNLLYDNQFMAMASDVAESFCMLEMANRKIKHIEQVLYIYNTENILSENKVNVDLQLKISKFITQSKRLESLKSQPAKCKNRLAVLNKNLPIQELVKMLQATDFVSFYKPNEKTLQLILDKIRQTKAIGFINYPKYKNSIPVSLSNEGLTLYAKHLKNIAIDLDENGIYNSKLILERLYNTQIYIEDEIILHP